MSDGDIEKSQPIILIGRGGGGTRLLSEMVKSLGVFLGNELNVSFDSVEWVEKIYALAIEKITTEFAASSLRDVYWRDEMRAQASHILAQGNRKPAHMWGWKLPETTLIVPQIMDYFPQARFIHLTRHPVTSCCRRTHMTSRLGNSIGAAALPAAYDYIGRSRDLLETDDIHIHNAASWAYQVDIALNALAQIKDSNRSCLIKFENLCDNPGATVEGLVYFLGLSTASSRANVAIDRERMKSGIYNPEQAAQVWDICQEVAGRVGYIWPES